MMRKALLTSVAVLAATGATAVPASAAPTWLPPGSFTGSWYPNPAIADDGLPVIGMETRAAPATARVAVGALGQSAFPEPVTLSGDAPGYQPRVAVNAGGDVAAAWYEGAHVWLAIKPAGGAFGAPIDVGSTGGFNASPGPQVGIGDNGDVALAWQAWAGGPFVTRWAIKPAGQPIGTPGIALDTSSSMVALSMSGDGHAVVAFVGKIGAAPMVVQAVSRVPGGTFGTPDAVSDSGRPAREPAVAVADGGGAIVGWRRANDDGDYVAQAARRVGGADFSAGKDLSAAGAAASNVEVGVNDAGEVVATWKRATAVQAAVGTLAAGFGPLTDFGTGLGPHAAISDSGAAIVTFAVGGGISAAVRPAGGAFPNPTSVAPEGEVLGGSTAAPVVMDAHGDALVTFLPNGYEDVGYRVLDAAGPILRDLAVPATATASDAVSLSVAPVDAFSPVAATHWDFGDGSSADGAAVSHAFGISGTFTVKVTATDAVGNATTATRTIDVAAKIAQAAPAPPGGGTITVPPPPPGTVKPCHVPSLKGLTKAKAKAKLTKAHCALGRTTTPKKLRKVKGLVVVKQSRKAATVVKNGATVHVTLGKKLKAKRR